MNARKAAMIQAFGELLEERPLNKITVRDIVERCGVNRNTFYYHFQDIPTLVKELLLTQIDGIIHNHPHLDSAEDCIRLLIRSCTECKQSILHVYHSIQQEACLEHLERLCQYMVEEYLEGATAGLGITPQDKQLLVRYHKCIMVGVVLDWLEADMGYDLQKAADRIFTLYAGSGEVAFYRASVEGRASTAPSPAEPDKAP